MYNNNINNQNSDNVEIEKISLEIKPEAEVESNENIEKHNDKTIYVETVEENMTKSAEESGIIENIIEEKVSLF